MGEFPSGQRGQTVNLLRIASMVRIRPPPPENDQSFRIGLFLRNGYLEDGFERRHLASVRGTLATDVARPQASESINIF